MSINWSLNITQVLAEKEARNGRWAEIAPEHLVMAVTTFAELPEQLLTMLAPATRDIQALLEEQHNILEYLQSMQQKPSRLRRSLRAALGNGHEASDKQTPLFSPASFHLLQLAQSRARQLGKEHPGAFDLIVIICLHQPTPILKKQLVKPLQTSKQAQKNSTESQPVDLADLTILLKDLRGKLSDIILGQDHAIHAFVEGLFTAEATAFADTRRKRPKGLFVFAGPPGVGKTFLAETGAEVLERPFLRLDMSGYSDKMGVILLAGAQRSYQDAKPGKLTSFVKEHPNAILLFDEIEKAALEVIHLFLQILDNGTLEDKFSEEDIIFKDTIVILTTNAGRSLYEEGVFRGGALHRRTILSALEGEIDLRTRQPFFPQAICSRMATGFPLMFNKLGITELSRIATAEMARVGTLFAKTHNKAFIIDPAVALCLVLREGARADARIVRSQTEIFVKSELFNLLRHLSTTQLQENLERTERLHFSIEEDQSSDSEAVAELLHPQGCPRVLLAVRNSILPTLLALEEVVLVPVADIDTMKTLVAAQDFDLALVDPWLGAAEQAKAAEAGMTVASFNKIPIGAKSLQRGMEFFRALQETASAPPTFLLSIIDLATGRPSIDDELLTSAARFGACGVISYGDSANAEDDSLVFSAQDLLSRFASSLTDTVHRLKQEKLATRLAAQGKILAFATSPAIIANRAELAIRLRHLRLVNAPDAADAAGLVSDAERPAIGFNDVFGADQAKTELRQIVEWLRNPGKFAAIGVKPPKGILLYGPPGTGKTLLARALAGESEVAFLAESATNFVTKYVGSGPENVRNLFARGRKYAPSIIFIDEIDAVGRKRQGTEFNRAQEETLNAILTEMDGFTTHQQKPAIVIAATNLVDSLDPALIRRFDREVEVDKPDKNGRLAFLHKRLAPGPCSNVSERILERIAGQSAGDTIANLERVIRLAGRRAAQGDGIINDTILEEAFETMRLGDAKAIIPDAKELLRIARHEAGHCLVGWLQGSKPVQITIIGRGRVGGYVESEIAENKNIATKGDLEKTIRRAMAGRAAEIIYYGEEEGLSSSVSGDLQQASRIAENMVRVYGMSDEPGLVALGDEHLRDGPLALAVVKAKSLIISSQLAAAQRLLETHRNIMDELVNQLIEKNRLVREDLEKIFQRLG